MNEISYDRELLLSENSLLKKKIQLLEQQNTDHELLERALLLQKTWFEQLFTNLSLAIAILDPEDRIVDVNKAFENIFQFTLEEIQGEKLNEVIVPESLAEEGSALTNRTFKGHVIEKETVRKRKDGSFAQVHILGVPIFINGTITSIFSIYEDISKRKTIEEELDKHRFNLEELVKERTAEVQRLVSIIEQSIESITLTDLDGKILFCNNTFVKFFGFNKIEVLGQNIRSLKYKIYDQSTLDEILKIFESGKSWSGKMVKMKKDGTIFQVKTSISPIYDSEGNKINYVIISEDISHEEELEKRLRQSQKMEAIGTLAGGIAHDFNNILSSMLGYTQLLQDLISDNTDEIKYLERILSGINRASDLAKQILTFSRQRESEMEPIQIAYIVKEALKLLRASIPSSIEIKQKIDNNTDIILADPTQIHQVVMNIATNARHAIPGGYGTIFIELENYITDKVNMPDLEQGKYVKLSISDDGIGMDKPTIDRIFEPYFTTKKVGEGTGLGLSVVHGIVKNHLGSISVESEVGKGTKFTILFPSTNISLYQKENENYLLKGGTENILIVDDEFYIADAIKDTLTNYGYKVVALFNSREVIDLLKENPQVCDLIISDLTMPGMLGTELAQEIKFIRKNLPFILTTGFNDSLDEKKLEYFGISQLLLKPIEKKVLLKAVREILDRSQNS